MTGLPRSKDTKYITLPSALFSWPIPGTFHGTIISFPVFVFCFVFATSVVALLQERLLGLQGGGTGAGGGDSEQIMLAGLAPEGTREWHDRRSGLPTGATKTIVAGQYEQVTRAIACLGVSVAQRNIRILYLSFIHPRFTNRGRRSRDGKGVSGYGSWRQMWIGHTALVVALAEFCFCAFFRRPGRTFWMTSCRIRFCSGYSCLQWIACAAVANVDDLFRHR